MVEFADNVAIIPFKREVITDMEWNHSKLWHRNCVKNINSNKWARSGTNYRCMEKLNRFQHVWAIIKLNGLMDEKWMKEMRKNKFFTV